jgi:hypothetical protein
MPKDKDDDKAVDDRPGVDADERAEELNVPDPSRVDEQDKPDLRPDTASVTDDLGSDAPAAAEASDVER